jgi:hypothetical protein
MTKFSLASQLRSHFVRQGYPAEEMLRRSDDGVIGMVAGKCSWCGQVHVQGEKLDLLIASSLDEKHFRGMWNDWNNSECPMS